MVVTIATNGGDDGGGSMVKVVVMAGMSFGVDNCRKCVVMVVKEAVMVLLMTVEDVW